MFESLPIHDRIVHALTAYDRKQSTRKGYNVYALPLYFRALDEACEIVAGGASWENALTEVFEGPVLKAAMKAVSHH